MRMEKRGRKGSAGFGLPVIDVTHIPVHPPKHLGAKERQRFVDLVASCQPEHFSEADVSLLCRYVELDLLGEEAARQLRENGAVLDGGKRVNPWVVCQEKSVRGMAMLALRLRLGPATRFDRRSPALRETHRNLLGNPITPAGIEGWVRKRVALDD